MITRCGKYARALRALGKSLEGEHKTAFEKNYKWSQRPAAHGRPARRACLGGVDLREVAQGRRPQSTAHRRRGPPAGLDGDERSTFPAGLNECMLSALSLASPAGAPP
jgi:hypothetical protein